MSVEQRDRPISRRSASLRFISSLREYARRRRSASPFSLGSNATCNANEGSLYRGSSYSCVARILEHAGNPTFVLWSAM